MPETREYDVDANGTLEPYLAQPDGFVEQQHTMHRAARFAPALVASVGRINGSLARHRPGWVAFAASLGGLSLTTTTK